MCGILASVGVRDTFHHRLLDSLRKRGPDGLGFWSNARVHLGHTRLRIIGLHSGADEPLENDRFVLVYNGEIYNFLELQHKVEQALGRRLRRVNDAQVLLEAWTLWGHAVLNELEGFWAFVIYDKEARTLTLVRDQLGIKPLYYWHDANGVCVSSMLRTILETVSTRPELDLAALSEYCAYQFTFGDKTFLKQIRKVLPGHRVTVRVDDLSLEDVCYEEIFAPAAAPPRLTDAAWIEETRALLKECVFSSTISDIAFTTTCSGGIDSSAITRITQPEVAYHCNFADPQCNETFFAQRVVQDVPTRLMVVNAQERFNLVERLTDIVEDFDELCIGSVILPLDDLLTQVKRRFKVLLVGSGGDELFGGYVRYQITQGECTHLNYRDLFRQVNKFTDPVRRFEMCHLKGDTSVYAFYDQDVAHGAFRDEFDRCGQGEADPMRTVLRFDARNFLPGLLTIDDRMCGRHSLEGRPSLLHQRLVRHMQQADTTDFMKNGELKYLFKKVLEGILPESVIYRKDKMGFTTPIGDFVNDNADRIREQITTSRFRHLYRLNKFTFTAQTKFSREVFGLLILDLWLNRYL